MTAARDTLRDGIGGIDRSARERLRLSGPDRAKFLHNLTTQDIKRLPPGRGVECFVTGPQGKTLGYLIVLATDDDLICRTDPGGLADVLPHFQKYGLFDEVAWSDARPNTFEYHLAGDRAGDLLRATGADLPVDDNYGHTRVTIAGQDLRIVRESPAGMPGFTLIGTSAGELTVLDALRSAGATFGLTAIDPARFESYRIAAGTPVFGRDVTPENLPQEVGRDRQAISFVKGCYLGQETVARIDALGHVNRLLKGLVFDGGPVPAPGASLTSGEKAVATVTSSATDPATGRPIALAYVRRQQAVPGTVLSGPDGPATVVDLPMPRE